MQAIDRIIQRSDLIPVFLGTAVPALASGLSGLATWQSDAVKLCAARAMHDVWASPFSGGGHRQRMVGRTSCRQTKGV